MKYVEMKKILNTLNKKWNLDFVSATSGDCCNTCGRMRTPEETEKWNNAKTYLVIKWFFKGMNYNLPFDKTEHHYIKYDFDFSRMNDICKDLQEALNGKFEVITPENDTSCIKLIKLTKEA